MPEFVPEEISLETSTATGAKVLGGDVETGAKTGGPTVTAAPKQEQQFGLLLAIGAAVVALVAIIGIIAATRPRG